MYRNMLPGYYFSVKVPENYRVVAKHLSQIVQSIVRLTKSLVEHMFSLTVLTIVVYILIIVVIFFVENL